jgi:hypothetical protein
MFMFFKLLICVFAYVTGIVCYYSFEPFQQIY